MKDPVLRDDVELAHPARPHLLAAAWAIAATVAEHWAGVHLEATAGEPLLTMATQHGAKPFATISTAAVAMTRDSETEHLDWFDILAQPFPTTTGDVIIEAFAPEQPRIGTADDAIAARFIAHVLANGVDSGPWEVIGNTADGWNLLRDDELVFSIDTTAGTVHNTYTRGHYHLADELDRVGGDHTLLAYRLLAIADTQIGGPAR